MKIETDGTQATLEINATLTATELDNLLRKLALLRSEMSPEVPHTRTEDPDMTVLIEDMPASVIKARKDGGFRLWLRHRGYGWLAYQIDNRGALAIGGYIAANALPEAINLVQHQQPHRH